VTGPRDNFVFYVIVSALLHVGALLAWGAAAPAPRPRPRRITVVFDRPPEPKDNKAPWLVDVPRNALPEPPSAETSKISTRSARARDDAARNRPVDRTPAFEGTSSRPVLRKPGHVALEPSAPASPQQRPRARAEPAPAPVVAARPAPPARAAPPPASRTPVLKTPESRAHQPKEAKRPPLAKAAPPDKSPLRPGTRNTPPADRVPTRAADATHKHTDTPKPEVTRAPRTGLRIEQWPMSLQHKSPRSAAGESGQAMFNVRMHKHARYYKRIRDRVALGLYLQRVARYVPPARGSDKAVVVAFRVMPDGRIDRIQLVDDGGMVLVAADIMSAIKSCSPIDKFPADMKDDHLDIQYHFLLE